MTVSTPYSGSLLRLAVTTIAIAAVFAAAFSFWENYGSRAHGADGRHSVPAMVR